MGRKLTITAFVFSLLIFIPFAPIVGLILGIVALSKAKDEPDSLKGLAIAAIVIGVIFGLINMIGTLGLMLSITKMKFQETASQFDDISAKLEQEELRQLSNYIESPPNGIKLLFSNIYIPTGSTEVISYGVRDEEIAINVNIDCTNSKDQKPTEDFTLEYSKTINANKIETIKITAPEEMTPGYYSCTINAGKHTERLFIEVN